MRAGKIVWLCCGGPEGQEAKGQSRGSLRTRDAEGIPLEREGEALGGDHAATRHFDEDDGMGDIGWQELLHHEGEGVAAVEDDEFCSFRRQDR